MGVALGKRAYRSAVDGRFTSDSLLTCLSTLLGFAFKSEIANRKSTQIRHFGNASEINCRVSGE